VDNEVTSAVPLIRCGSCGLWPVTFGLDFLCLPKLVDTCNLVVRFVEAQRLSLYGLDLRLQLRLGHDRSKFGEQVGVLQICVLHKNLPCFVEAKNAIPHTLITV
jgi:hypothetical protein